MVLKYCPRHQALLPVTHFNRNHTRYDGLCAFCKDCEGRSALLRYSTKASRISIRNARKRQGKRIYKSKFNPLGLPLEARIE